MKIPPVKGTRDFYPAEMAVRNWIIDGWKKVSLRNGFEEYDGPIFEYLKMFQIKSGDEIAEQLFSLKDRGGRDLAIRPEITPTLARMVNQQINSLPRPIKWFSVPRLCRAERPQRGRLREFFQWNIDIIGIDDVLADAEVIFTTVDYLRDIGLTSQDIKVRISSRKLLNAVLKSFGIPDETLESLYLVLDKKSKVRPKAFNEMLNEKLTNSQQAEKVQAFMKIKKFSEMAGLENGNKEVEEAANELVMLNQKLKLMEIDDYCVFDPSIVRGLAYYTGIVFEVHAVGEEIRAICGGGRYDNLLQDFGGPQIPATGMGMGDCVLEIMLREKGLFNNDLPARQLDYFIIPVGEKTKDDKEGLVVTTPEDEAVKLTAKLRLLGFKTEFTYKSTSLSKHLKEAVARNAQNVVIIGSEFIEGNELVVRDMKKKVQENIDYDKFLKQLSPRTG